MKNNNLETRIKNIAANMEGTYIWGVQHSIFVEWDATWDISDDLGINENSTDEEIKEAILTSENWHDEYYQDEVQAYIEEHSGNN